MLLFGLASTFWLGITQHDYNGYLVAIFCTGVGISGAQAGLNALSGAAYPSLIRSTGSGWALGVGRLGNIFGPMLGGILLGAGLEGRYVLLSAVCRSQSRRPACSRWAASATAPTSGRSRCASRPEGHGCKLTTKGWSAERAPPLDLRADQFRRP